MPAKNDGGVFTYLRKASLSHLPKAIIVESSIFALAAVVAAPIVFRVVRPKAEIVSLMRGMNVCLVRYLPSAKRNRGPASEDDILQYSS